MKKIFLATLTLVPSIAVTMHTSLIAMETGPKIQIVNNGNRPIEVTYTRAKDNRQRLIKVLPEQPLVIEQYLGNPVQEMTLRTIGSRDEQFVREVKPEDISALSKSTGTIYVGSNKLIYSLEMVGEKPITFFGKKPKVYTFEELGKPKEARDVRSTQPSQESTKPKARDVRTITQPKESRELVRTKSLFL